MSAAEGSVWPRADYSRVPYRLYHDRALFAREMERVFRGPAWLFLGLEAEIPNAGDFRTTWLGDTPVVYNRARDGEVHAFVNRCAHRGAIVRREAWGNAADHTCIYHRWCYDLEGRLIGVPFQRGVRGKGGMAADFDKAEHGLRKLRVASYHGVLFATFRGAEVEPLLDYLGPHHAAHLARTMHKPLKVLGYQRQHVHGNWKFYNENLRDLYHGTLLHAFPITFAVARMTHEGGSKMDPRHRHNLSWVREGTDDDEESHRAYRDEAGMDDRRRLSDEAILDYVAEYADGIDTTICSVFPNAVFQQFRNSLATRQIRPKSENAFELFWTLFGYADDDDAMTRRRLTQANMVGPAGYVSMEDAEAVEIAHRATSAERDASAVVEFGGTGAIAGTESESLCTDVPCRGFWSYYAELMGIEAAGGIR